MHTGNVRTETDYKTLLVNTHATAEEVVNTLLSKFRLTTRDPKLFRLTMEIKTKREGKRDDDDDLLRIMQLCVIFRRGRDKRAYAGT